MRLPFIKTRKVKCKDGSTRTVWENIDDVFPIYVKSSTKKASASVDTIQGVGTQVNHEQASALDALLLSLDGRNQSLMAQFRAAYIIYATNPCENDEFFQGEVKRINLIQDKLAAAKLVVDAFVAIVKGLSDPNRIESLYGQLIGHLGEFVPKQAASQAIESSRSDASKWLEDQDGC